ncbi:MAG: helix-turn-helix domain-containing protein [Casimicrobiaceae bacterium]
MLHTLDHPVDTRPQVTADARANAGAMEHIARIGRARLLTEGTSIHRAGELFRSVFLLRSGATKRLLVQEDGREQILGFQMPGDLIGLESIHARTHSTTVVAIDLCSVVEIPYDALEALALENAEVRKLLFQRLGMALREEYGWMAALGQMNAEERVAAFLLDLSRRFAARGFSPRRFMLRMTRAEIGCFLGLTLETVSRVFSRFQKNGLIRSDRREIELLDSNALARLALATSVAGLN